MAPGSSQTGEKEGFEVIAYLKEIEFVLGEVGKVVKGGQRQS